jgi:hypothetical protein
MAAIKHDCFLFDLPIDTGEAEKGNATTLNAALTSWHAIREFISHQSTFSNNPPPLSPPSLH